MNKTEKQIAKYQLQQEQKTLNDNFQSDGKGE